MKCVDKKKYLQLTNGEESILVDKINQMKVQIQEAADGKGRHINVVDTLFISHDTENLIYIAMELCENKDLVSFLY